MSYSPVNSIVQGRPLSTMEILGGVLNSDQDALKVAGGGTAGSPSSGVGTVQGIGYSASHAFTRPNDTTAYAALDVVGETGGVNATFSGIGPSGGGKILIDRATLRIDVSAIPSGMTSFRLHLYNAAPTAIADNAAFDLPSGDRAKYLGFIEIPTPLDLGATLFSGTEELNLPVRMQVTVASGGALYGIMQTVSAYTPTAQAVKTIALHSVLLG